MAQTSGPWEVPAPGAEAVGDATRTGFGVAPWRRMMRAFGDGVIRDFNDDSLRVFASTTDRTVGVMPGEALLQGGWFQGTPSSTGRSTTAAFDIPTAAGTYRVVLRYDPATNTIRLFLKGSASLTRVQDGVWEMSLATITAAAAGGPIPPEAVRDDRVDTTSNLYRELLEARLVATESTASRAFVGISARHRTSANRALQSNGAFSSLAINEVQFGYTGSQRGGEATRLYVTERRRYLYGGQVTYAEPPSGAAVAGIREGVIALNGSPQTVARTGVVRSDRTAAVDIPPTLALLNPGDYLEVQGRQTQGAAIEYTPGTHLWLTAVGTA